MGEGEEGGQKSAKKVSHIIWMTPKEIGREKKLCQKLKKMQFRDRNQIRCFLCICIPNFFSWRHIDNISSYSNFRGNWIQYYKIDFAQKKTELVLNYLMAHYFDLTYTVSSNIYELNWSKSLNNSGLI